jgi:hypothetical protein
MLIGGGLGGSVTAWWLVLLLIGNCPSRSNEGNQNGNLDFIRNRIRLIAVGDSGSRL